MQARPVIVAVVVTEGVYGELRMTMPKCASSRSMEEFVLLLHSYQDTRAKKESDAGNQSFSVLSVFVK